MLEAKTESGSIYHIDTTLKTWARVEAPATTGAFPLRTAMGHYHEIEVEIGKPIRLFADPIDPGANMRLIRTSPVVSLDEIPTTSVAAETT